MHTYVGINIMKFNLTLLMKWSILSWLKHIRYTVLWYQLKGGWQSCQDFTFPAHEVANNNYCTFYIIRTYRQYIHEVFHLLPFPTTSPSRVTTWWWGTSCREWWRWLAHDSTSRCALKLAWNLSMQQASRRSSLTHTYTHTYYTYTVLVSHTYTLYTHMYYTHWYIRTINNRMLTVYMGGNI